MTSSDAASVCINIGPSERRRRLVFGLVAAALSVGLLVFFVSSGQSRALRLVLFVPWLFAAMGVFQARESTCVALAGRDQRNLDRGIEPMPEAEREAIRRRARKVYIESTVSATLLTVLSLLLEAA